MKKINIIFVMLVIGMIIPSISALNYKQINSEIKDENIQYIIDENQVHLGNIYTSATEEISVFQTENTQLPKNYLQSEKLDGWTVTLDTFAIHSSPVAYDFDMDGYKEIVVTTFGDAVNPYGSGKIYILSSDGNVVSGWPFNTTGPCPATPAIGDLDNDGVVEIVATCWGYIFVFHFDGSIVWQKYDYGIASTAPVLTDLDLDGNLDIVLTSRPGKIYAWDSNGDSISGWPVTIDPTYQYELSTPVACDLDQDSYVEIIVNTEDDKTYVFNHDGTILSGWPVTIPNDPDVYVNVYRPPALGDIDDDGDIEIIRDGGTYLYLFEADGTISSGWPQSTAKYQNIAFALGLIDDDEIPEILFNRVVSGDTYIYGFCGDGTNAPNFPIILTDKIAITPCTIGDLDNDGEREIVMRTEGEMYIFNSDGSLVSGWPQNIFDNGHTGSFNPAPLITDLDSDGDIELVVNSCFNQVTIFEFPGPYNPATADWPMYQHDLYHTGLFSIFDNNAPSSPSIDGPASGAAGELYEYSFVSTDPDADTISYVVDWGDNSSLEIFGPEDSGVEVFASHSWEEEGTYLIKVKARDVNGLESDWAVLEIEMPVNKIFNHPILQSFFMRFPNAFFILRLLLGL